jgi:hypothetical protein
LYFYAKPAEMQFFYFIAVVLLTCKREENLNEKEERLACSLASVLQFKTKYCELKDNALFSSK